MQRFRPLGLGDIFDEAFDLYKRHFLSLLLVTAVVSVPVRIAMGYLTIHGMQTQSAIPPPSDPTEFFSWLWNSLAGSPALYLLSGLGVALEYTALASASWSFFLEEPLTLWPIYREPLRRFFPLLGTGLLYAIAMGLGFCLCGIGMIWPGTVLLFVCQIFVVERAAGFKALRRSSALVNGYGNRIVGALLLLGFVTGFITLGLTLPINYALDLLFRVAPSLPGGVSGGVATGLAIRQQIIAQISQGLAGLMVTPFAITVITILYYDLRVRKEAFDIDILARGLNYPPLASLSGYLPPALPMPILPRALAPPPTTRGGPR